MLVAIAQALGISTKESQQLPSMLIGFLQKRQLLLVLDNVEQIEGAAPHIQDLVLACPRLTVLTTSRMALHLQGEQIFPLSPLALPDLTTTVEPDLLLQSPAIALFVHVELSPAQRS